MSHGNNKLLVNQENIKYDFDRHTYTRTQTGCIKIEIRGFILLAIKF